MIDGGVGWGTGRVKDGQGTLIVRTTDGGNSWTNITPPEAVYTNIGRSMEPSTFFLDASHAWVLYWETDKWSPQSGVELWATSDGGANWKGAKIPITGYTLQYFRNVQIGFVDQNVGWVFAKVGRAQTREFIGLFTTNDGGASWQMMVTSDSANLPSIGTKNGAAFRNSLEGWITGANTVDDPSALIWRTYDGGNSWAKQTLPLPDVEGVPTDLFTNAEIACALSVPKFVDFQYQYAYMTLKCSGGSLSEPLAVIYWTYDTFSTWHTMKLPKPEGNLEFYGIYNGWYSQAAESGTSFSYEILSTADGGTTWNIISQTAWDSQLQFITAAVGFGLVTYNDHPALVRTGDGGYSWEQVFPMINP